MLVFGVLFVFLATCAPNVIIWPECGQPLNGFLSDMTATLTLLTALICVYVRKTNFFDKRKYYFLFVYKAVILLSCQFHTLTLQLCSSAALQLCLGFDGKRVRYLHLRVTDSNQRRSRSGSQLQEYGLHNKDKEITIMGEKIRKAGLASPISRRSPHTQSTQPASVLNQL